MIKRGKAYEKLVSEVFRSFDETLSVVQGKWVQGPDGRRDMDVLVTGRVNNKIRKVLIECKDFNPRTTGAVGINLIDSLESKRRDLNVDEAFICSNAGFTEGALNKSRRVGIGVISILRKGDNRIKYLVSEVLYTRHILVTNSSFSFNLAENTPPNLNNINSFSISYKGLPVANWVIERIMVLIGLNPIVQGNWSATHTFINTVLFDAPNGSFFSIGLNLDFSISGSWYAQNIEIDSTGAVYDWIRRRVRVVPGPGSVELKGLNIYHGNSVDRPPDSYIMTIPESPRGEMSLNLLMIEGPQVSGQTPNLSILITPEDLELIIKDIPYELTVSDPGFSKFKPKANDSIET